MKRPAMMRTKTVRVKKINFPLIMKKVFELICESKKIRAGALIEMPNHIEF
jgi:hypothetical protein